MVICGGGGRRDTTLSGIMRGGGGARQILNIFIISTLLVTPAVSDFRNVSYEALVHKMETFSETGIGHFSEILFNVKRYELIVGARDALFRLSMDGLKKLEKADWPASPTNIGLCTTKGQSEEMCRNYIKVLVSHNDQVFACGTHAFSPKCSWREIGEIQKVTRLIDGRAKCPYSPNDNATAMITSTGDLFIGSATDFQSTDHAIYRMKGHGFDQYTLRTVQQNSKWLNTPDFVTQFETKDFVYFIFRETATEVMNCGKAIYSRIARVCKNDQGGSPVLKNQWTTFLKARLNCSIPGEFPFYYNEIQSAVYVESEEMVYATFTTGSNSIAGAALCNFNMTSIEQAFMGDFKYQSNAASTWSPARADHEYFQCHKTADGDDLLTSTKYQLMDSSVASVLPLPLHMESLNRYGQIAVDTVNIKNQYNKPVHVVFVATQEGSIKKFSYNPSTKESCLVETLWPFPGNHAPAIRKMKLLSYSSSPAALYIATDSSILRLPVQRCDRFKTHNECHNAMDPYCGWDKQRGECVTAPNKNPNVAYWQQNLIRCPILTDPVNGGWGEWSDWNQCAYNNPNTRVNDDDNFCSCRRRKCDSPAPSNGGSSCIGPDLLVENCTQHGGWTQWSEWSGCTQSCGTGLKTRHRQCGNPAPAFGGKTCVGRNEDDQWCSDLPKCESHYDSTLAGASDNYVSMDPSLACGDHEDMSQSTPWVNVTTDNNGGWEERRWTFNYKSYSSLASINKAIVPSLETRTSGQQEDRSSASGHVQSRSQDTVVCPDDIATHMQEGSSINMIIGACVIGFMLGSIVGAGLVYYYFKVKKNGGLNPPHYISAKSQNLYVSLPMLDLNKTKQLSSNQSDYTGTLRSNNGTLRSNKTGSSIYASTKPGEYETATIKRSHSRRDSSLINNSSIRADLDSDLLFT